MSNNQQSAATPEAPDYPRDKGTEATLSKDKDELSFKVLVWLMFSPVGAWACLYFILTGEDIDKYFALVGACAYVLTLTILWRAQKETYDEYRDRRLARLIRFGEDLDSPASESQN